LKQIQGYLLTLADLPAENYITKIHSSERTITQTTPKLFVCDGIDPAQYYIVRPDDL